MCGIAGIFNYADRERPVDRDLLVRMTRKIAHRGPDAEGFWFHDNVGLGHRRLSIVDLSPTGAQPMASDDGQSQLTYNGEFYNHAEFRERLGGRFRGSSDTETMLRLMEQEGPEALKNVSGIFAFGWWNGREEALTLVRDHMGVKQVYYHDDGRRIVFASEVKALLEDPTVPREADPEAINQYLHFHTALFDRTFFRHVKVVPAGHSLRITRYGAHMRRYWSLDSGTYAPGRVNDLVDELELELSAVVERQLMSDVPVGSFFSGGIDSSAIAAKAAKAGKRPMCFGVHFTGQGVTDERPYQEAAAKALGLDLQLITMDGSTFPEDFRRLMYHQDEPVIGSAMFPMSKVSELAAGSVKVCLGGQAADELFGGYARYALVRPGQVLSSWFSGRKGMAQEAAGARSGKVGGNLTRQFASVATLKRMARNLRHLTNWETSYFEHFASVPEERWHRILAAREFCSRGQAMQQFHERVTSYQSKDPADRIMRWDVDTYLTGLFHQDDRMSMAASLESRVPFADPRIAQFAFGINPDLKLRGGASKWILRQAVASVLPPVVLNRRKVGFDTPTMHWMTDLHAGFVRETLLSVKARQRGFWNAEEIERFLAHPGTPGWQNILWKVLSIEVWASVFLEGANGFAVQADRVETHEPRPRPRHLARELREMGLRGTLARGWWEVKTRSGLVRVQATEPEGPPDFAFPVMGGAALPFTEPEAVASAMRGHVETGALLYAASEASRGHIVCFSKWVADYGNPINWHRDPTNGHLWRADSHWSRALAGSSGAEVKFTWEAARFPQAFTMARAAAFHPDAATDLGTAFASQVSGFIRNNPAGKGVHWFSGQEVALRMLSMLFGYQVFSRLGVWPEGLSADFGRHIYSCGEHIASHIEYAKESVYNNHLLAEALGIFVAGLLLPGTAPPRWRTEGMEILVEQAGRQFYPDGAYIQQSHNYQRGALQLYLWGVSLLRKNGITVPREWMAALERSLDFLVAHQNPEDGQLPNFGPNDGSLPVPLGSSEFGDFRPVLQAVSVAARNERIYSSGPWDEMAVWMFGPEVVALPVRNSTRKSVSFPDTGYHVLRGEREDSFGAFRCGTLRDRFAQIDMLHLDVWWRGQNVLTDGGSYRYNGAPQWHNHFMRTESHNTVGVDGHDQMLHFRQFKTIYWTEAGMLRFEDKRAWAVAEGEHYGYQRSAECTHRRAVLFVKDDLWVVADTIWGRGSHTARLHWLAGSFPYSFDAENARLSLETPRGEFCVTVLDATGSPMPDADVVAGAQDPPRGWRARYYGEKEPLPSLAVSRSGTLPLTFVSLLSAGRPSFSIENGEWNVALGEVLLRFRLADGLFSEIAV